MNRTDALSRRLRRLGWLWRATLQGEPFNSRQAEDFAAELAACAEEAERIEVEAGRGDVVTRLRAAGGDVARLRAALGGRHVQ